MLLALFVIAALAMVFAAVRRPYRSWQRITMALAAFIMLSVIVAWIIERWAQQPM